MDGNAFKLLQASAEAIDVVIEEQKTGRWWDKRSFVHLDPYSPPASGWSWRWLTSRCSRSRGTSTAFAPG